MPDIKLQPETVNLYARDSIVSTALTFFKHGGTPQEWRRICAQTSQSVKSPEVALSMLSQGVPNTVRDIALNGAILTTFTYMKAGGDPGEWENLVDQACAVAQEANQVLTSVTNGNLQGIGEFAAKLGVDPQLFIQNIRSVAQGTYQQG